MVSQAHFLFQQTSTERFQGIQKNGPWKGKQGPRFSYNIRSKHGELELPVVSLLHLNLRKLCQLTHSSSHFSVSAVSTGSSLAFIKMRRDILILQALYPPDIFPIADSGIFSKKFTGKSYIFSSFCNRKKLSQMSFLLMNLIMDFSNDIFSINEPDSIRYVVFL